MRSGEFFPLLVITALLLAGNPVAAQQSSLSELVAIVRTLDFESDDADLMQLADAIGDARIVVLGEATHSDGAASRAKTRVARFLHERMGFDVLAWESGFLQCHAMNAALRDTAYTIEQAASFLMSGGWAWDEDIQPLFRHARASWRTDRPLIMAGFDTGRPHRAAPYFMKLLDDAFARLPSLMPTPADRSTIHALAQRAFGFLSSEPTPPDVRAAQLGALSRLETRLAVTRDSLLLFFSDRELAFLDRALEHARVSERLKEARGVERAYNRDGEMAKLIRWLAEEMYPDRKIIIWAATAHFVRNSDRITNPLDSTMYVVPYHAGNHLAAWFGEDSYTIAFTSYDGELGDVHPPGSAYESRTRRVEPAGEATVEAALYRLAHPFAFVDVARAVARGAVAENFSSLVLGRIENIAPWATVLDGLFFIRRSEPVRYIH